MATTKPPLLRIAIAVAVVLLILVGLYRYWLGSNNNAGELLLYGNVDMREVELAFVVQERLTQVQVEEGDRVQTGQLLAEVDPGRFQQAVRQREAELEAARQRLAELEHGSRPEEIRRAKAELATAQATEREARLSHHRIKELVEKKLASPKDLDNAEATLDAARAHVEAAKQNLALVEAGPRQESVAAAKAQVSGGEAALARARKDLDDTRLYAPAPGIVQARILEVGDIAGPQKPVFTLALHDPLWVRAYVSEPDLGKLSQGMPAEVHADAYPGKVYPGKVGYISPSAEFTPKTVQTTDVRSSLVYQVRVLVPDPQGELRLGMPVTVTIPLEQAFAIPQPGAE